MREPAAHGTGGPGEEGGSDLPHNPADRPRITKRLGSRWWTRSNVACSADTDSDGSGFRINVSAGGAGCVRTGFYF